MWEKRSVQASTEKAESAAGGGLSGGSAAWKPRESPEVQLLLLCARSRMTPAAETRVRALAAAALDWTYILRLTMRHGLGPLLHWNLQRICPEQVPAEIARPLQDFSERSRYWNEHLAAEGARAYQALQGAGIAAVAYRELSLSAALAYGDAPLRQMECADFLIAPADTLRAREALLAAGYAVPPQGAPGSGPFDSLGYQWFTRDGGPAPLLLFWSPGPRHHGIEFDFEGIARRARTLRLGNHEVPGLCNEDLLLMICAYSTRYFWDVMEWVCDAGEVASSTPLDWATAERAAQEMRAERALRLGVLLASDLLGTALPAEVLGRAAGDAAVQRVARTVIARTFDSAPPPIRSIYSSWFYFHLRHGVRQRAVFLLRMMFSPTEADWKVFPLAKGWFFLFVILRPARLLWRVAELGVLRPLQRVLKVRRKVSSYAPTPMPVVERMLELAEFQPGDVLYDLGCGDGRIVVEAARRYGIRGVGVDLDAQRVAESRSRADAAGVQNLVQFVRADAMKTDVSAATVVTLYLPGNVQMQMRAKLQRELRPGARVISHGADVGGWSRAEIADYEGYPSPVYLWKV